MKPTTTAIGPSSPAPGSCASMNVDAWLAGLEIRGQSQRLDQRHADEYDAFRTPLGQPITTLSHATSSSRAKKIVTAA
jgi:hypothetical protein